MRGDEDQAMQPADALKVESRDGGAKRGVEAETAAAIASGDHRAAIALCAGQYGALIGRLCMSLLGSQADAEDVTQETLVDAYRGFAGFRGEGSVRAWLLTIARRKCARHLERRGRHHAKLRLVEADAAAADTEQVVLTRQRAERARAALVAVRPSEREALVLRYGAGLSFAEVAQAFDIEEAAARKRVSRGVAALRERLQQEGQG